MKIARLGDPSNHGGSIVNVQTVKTFAESILVSIDGDLHACPIPGHGVTPISAITVKTYVEGKLLNTTGALAGCGARIYATAIKSDAEGFIPVYTSPGGGNDPATAPVEEGGEFTGSTYQPVAISIHSTYTVDVTRVPPNMLSNAGLGALSERYESNGNPCAIGYDSVGGHSYGQYQIATNTGTFDRYMTFLQNNDQTLYNQLNSAGGSNGAKQGSTEFKNKWNELCTDHNFAKSQHDFIQSTHYEPARSSIFDKTGMDINNRPKAVQDVIWSTSVQHGPGGATTITERAIASTGKTANELSDAELINAIYR